MRSSAAPPPSMALASAAKLRRCDIVRAVVSGVLVTVRWLLWGRGERSRQRRRRGGVQRCAAAGGAGGQSLRAAGAEAVWSCAHRLRGGLQLQRAWRFVSSRAAAVDERLAAEPAGHTTR